MNRPVYMSTSSGSTAARSSSLRAMRQTQDFADSAAAVMPRPGSQLNDGEERNRSTAPCGVISVANRAAPCLAIKSIRHGT